jgi:molybdate transport system substrate-binding protein
MLVAVLTFTNLLAAPAIAGETNVAVAANFAEPAMLIAALFQVKTGHHAILGFGASGTLLMEISNDAPYQVFLSADEKRANAAVERGYAVPGTQFTYAVGRLVLWSKVVDVTDGDHALKAGAFTHLAMPSPEIAAYGTAAVQTMEALGVHDALRDRIVQTTSTRKTFELVDMLSSEVGFVALSQLRWVDSGTRWLVPQNLYAPLRQNAVLLKKGENDAASRAFLAFLQSPEARDVIEKFGYGLTTDLVVR